MQRFNTENNWFRASEGVRFTWGEPYIRLRKAQSEMLERHAPCPVVGGHKGHVIFMMKGIGEATYRRIMKELELMGKICPVIVEEDKKPVKELAKY